MFNIFTSFTPYPLLFGMVVVLIAAVFATSITKDAFENNTIMTTRIAVSLLLCLTMFIIGYKLSDDKWGTRVQSAQERIKELEKQSKEVNVEIKEVYIDRPIEIIKERTRKVIETIPIIVKEQNESCKITDDIVDIHNQAMGK